MFEEEPDAQREATDATLLASPKDWKEQEYSVEQQLKAPRGALFETRLEAAEALRSVGNERVKAGDLDGALEAYRRALWQVDFDEGYVKLEMLPEHQLQVYEAQVPIRLNMAQCLMKSEGQSGAAEAKRQAQAAVDAADEYALQPKWRIKALYWRAKARLATGAYDDAESDLKAAAALDPNDKLIRAALADVRRQRSDLRRDQRALYDGKLNPTDQATQTRRWCSVS